MTEYASYADMREKLAAIRRTQQWTAEQSRMLDAVDNLLQQSAIASPKQHQEIVRAMRVLKLMWDEQIVEEEKKEAGK